ncbi:HAD hydrolase-like protein [Draconibacterium sp. IB214405]|uniref:HAD family hydrolase n=1 Tax=Draconibacterium sp. IB214405 TaxID=3097352 RepID=UPI002A1176E5|nr:HAD family hydrolase [Draconibacterium sp. IB214405]MDX8339474.1 HAD hydrolase-like protein [Draconibacterium sp. IB214405]
MELNFRNDIKKWLDSSEKLQPIPTTFCPNLKTDSKEKIKAVIFDIYGTLLISSSGDIDQASLNKDNMRAAMEAGGFDFTSCKEDTCSFLLDQLQLQVKKQHEELKTKGHPFPDVDIFKVWSDMFEAAEKEGLLKLSGNESWTDTIMVFELLSNRVYPMPGMKEVLLEIKKMGIPIGIVSNAQFYTPIIMNYFLTGEFKTDQHIDLFEEDLAVYSYKELRAKPDTALFDKFIPALINKYDTEPSETIFVGNDMLKDVYTATKAGVRTVLFAGDERSLRLREDDPRVKGMFPDFIINDLQQLLKIIG